MAFVAAERARLPASANGCMLCALADTAYRPEHVVAENEHAVARLNLLPCREADFMVVTRRHVERALEVHWAEQVALHELAHRGARILEAERGARRVYVAQLGAVDDLPMTFPHVHLHVVPLYAGGEEARPARVFSWSANVGVYEPAEAEALAGWLRAAFARTPPLG